MPGAELGTSLWIKEFITPYDYYAHGVTRVLAYAQTEFQEMYVVESGAYGKALVLDAKWQSCTGDEYLYHEPLVHPGLLACATPRRVLILGGGEGATAREALKWKSVDRVVMIDIDGEVVEACKRHLPEMHQGAFDDPRLDVRIEDALHYLDTIDEQFDVVISDLSDPIEDGPSFKLFTREYFAKAKRVLADGGILVVQSGPVSPIEMGLHAKLRKTLAAVFPHTASLSTYVPTYAAPWSMILASERPLEQRPDPAAIDARLSDEVDGPLRMFDGQTLLGMLQIPKNLRERIANETMVYSLEAPPKFFGKGQLGDA